jgi:hypothetical protein
VYALNQSPVFILVSEEVTMKPLIMSATTGQPTKKAWESPRIVVEYSLVAKAQGPILGEDSFQKIEEDPFLGAFTASGI